MKTENITLSNNDKLALISNLSTMLTAGIPILEAVDSLLEDAKKNPKKLLEILHEDLIQGKQVHYTFSRFPLVFDKVTVNIIKASEEAGTLDVILKDLRSNIKKEIEFNDKIKSAFIYPIFVMIVFFGILLIILTVVIPKISSVFSQLKVTLPLPTKILIVMSDGLLHYTIPVVLGVGIFVTGMVFLFRREKAFFTNIFLTFPLISKLAREIDITRFSRSLYLLLNAGIPISNALLLVQDVVKKKEVSRAILHAHEEVIAGKKLSSGFNDMKQVIPGLMIKITQAGERSGTLDKSMLDISEYFDYQVTNTLKVLTSLLEPIMLVLVGIMTGGIMLAIIAPMYGLISQVGNH